MGKVYMGPGRKIGDVNIFSAEAERGARTVRARVHLDAHAP